MMLDQSRDEINLVYALARDLGIPVVHARPTFMKFEHEKLWDKDGIYWDGRVMHVRNTDQLMHEIAHWFESSETEKQMANWGLYPDDEHSNRREERADDLETVLRACIASAARQNIATVQWRGA